MADDGAPDADTLARLRDLCSDLSGEVGNGQLLAWAEQSLPADVPDVVFSQVRDAGLLGDSVPARGRPARAARSPWPQQTVSVPVDADELWARIWQVDEAAAIDVLVSLMTGSVRDRSRRARRLRRYEAEPEAVLAKLADLIGPGTHWWTNTDLTEWNPVTQHTFDAIVIGAGNGLVITVIGFDSA